MMTENSTFPAKKSGPILALLFGVLFIGVVDNQVVLPILSLIAATLHRPVAQVGWAVTGYALAAAAQNLLFGPLSDYFGRKPVLLFGLAGFTLTGYLLSIAPVFSTFLLLRALMGLFAGILSTCVTAYVGDYFPYAVRGRAMGTVMASYFAALVVGVPLGAVIADRWNWHWIFRGMSLLAILLLLLTVWFLPRLHGSRGLSRGNVHAERAGTTSDGGSADRAALMPMDAIRWNTKEHFERYRHYLSSPEKFAALISGAFVSGATLALLTFVSPWLMRTFALSASKVGLVFLLAGTASVVASPLSGWISDLFGKRRLFLSSSFVNAFLVLLLPWAGGMRKLLLLFFAVALAIAFRQTAQQTLITELTPTHGRGSFVALRNCFSQAGIGLSVFLASFLFQRYGFQGVVIFSAAQSLLGACFFFAVREPALVSDKR